MRLKAFFVSFTEHFRDGNVLSDPAINPVTVLTRMEAVAPRRAREGLLIAIRDSIEESARLGIAEVKAIDAAFAARGAPTLTEMRLRFARNIQSILKRGMIRTEVEYHAIRNIADAGDGAELHTLLADYEQRMAIPKPGSRKI